MTRLDVISARWAWRLGDAHRAAHPAVTVAERAKLCPFRADTPHAVWWLRGFLGEPFVTAADRRAS